MCRRGDWRGIDTTHIQGNLCAIEQCSACDNYRAKKIEDAPVVGFSESDGSSGEPPSDQESPDHEGW